MEQKQISLNDVYQKLEIIETILREREPESEFKHRKKSHKKIPETAVLSEKSLAEEWLTPEENEAWKDL